MHLLLITALGLGPGEVGTPSCELCRNKGRVRTRGFGETATSTSSGDALVAFPIIVSDSSTVLATQRFSDTDHGGP